MSRNVMWVWPTPKAWARTRWPGRRKLAKRKARRRWSKEKAREETSHVARKKRHEAYRTVYAATFARLSQEKG